VVFTGGRRGSASAAAPVPDSSAARAATGDGTSDHDAKDKIRGGLIALLATVAPVLASGETGARRIPSRVIWAFSIWTLVIFLVVVILLGKFLWGPILNGLQSGASVYRQVAHRCRAGQQDRASAVGPSTPPNSMPPGPKPATLSRKVARDAEEVKRAIGEEARKEADAMIERAKREIGIARDAALRELLRRGRRSGPLRWPGKIVSRELNPADHEQLIQESIAELGKLDLRSN
jgi:F-type H+-transporting ATPase subunit b